MPENVVLGNIFQPNMNNENFSGMKKKFQSILITEAKTFSVIEI